MPRAKPGARAVFLDRDGVLNEEVDYLGRVEDLVLVPGAAQAVVALKKAGFKVVVISNQSGVARGYFDEKALAAVTAALEERLAADGARLDGIFYCPHLPDAGCPCRKPGTRLLETAAGKLDLDLSRSYFVGDSTVDVRTALNAGCVPILVRTGKAGKDGRFDGEPAAIVDDLAAAARWILK